MNDAYVPDLIFVLLIVIPFIWSGVVTALKSSLGFKSAGNGPGDRIEKIFLLLMVFPVLVGAFLCAAFILLPDNVSALQIQFAPGGVTALLPASDTLHSSAGILSWAPPFLSALALGYGAVVAIRAIQLCTSHFCLQETIRRARKSDAVPLPGVLVTDEAISPFVSLSGEIILPHSLTAKLSKEQLRLVVAHEQAHLDRGDPVYFLILAVTDALFWFNPFIRIQTKNCRLAAEIDCDRIVTGADADLRKPYAMAIISTLELVSTPQAATAATLFSKRRKGDFSVRITEIMNNHKPTHRKSTRVLVASLFALAIPVTAMQLAYAETAAGNAPVFSIPALTGKITSTYGSRQDPISNKERHHDGVDIKAPHGTPVLAPADGTVAQTQNLPDSYGLLLTIDHGNGYITRYANLSSFNVSVSDKVAGGQVIAKVGSTGRSTGPHLHIEVLKDGSHIDPATVLMLPERN